MDIHQIIANDIIYEVEGLAPYSFSSTKKALSFVNLSHNKKKIANIGSGTGYPSIILQEILKENIISVDHRASYVMKFRQELSIQRLDKYITPIFSSLTDLPFEKNELDLIWAESVAKDLPFAEGLNCWNKYLATDGYIGLCAYCWNSTDKPQPVVDFFRKNKMDNQSIGFRIDQMLDAGFVPVAHFTLPEECWWNYFCPLDINKDLLLKKYFYSTDVVEFVDKLEQEISLFEKYADSYSYVFFIGKKV